MGDMVFHASLLTLLLASLPRNHSSFTYRDFPEKNFSRTPTALGPQLPLPGSSHIMSLSVRRNPFQCCCLGAPSYLRQRETFPKNTLLRLIKFFFFPYAMIPRIARPSSLKPPLLHGNPFSAMRQLLPYRFLGPPDSLISRHVPRPIPPADPP